MDSFLKFKPSLALLLCVAVICFTELESAHALDFGSIVDTFSSGVSTAAKVPSNIVSSAYESVRPGNEEGRTTASIDESTSGYDSTSRSTASNSRPNQQSSTMNSRTSYDDRTEEYMRSSTPVTSHRPSDSERTQRPDRIVSKGTSSTTTKSKGEGDDGEGATTESGSWVPDIIKKPIEAVASVPNTVASGVGQAWNTVSETVVNQDPEHSVKFYLYDNPRDLMKYKQLVVGQPDTLRDVNFPQGSRVNILIHGFMQDYNSSFPQKMKDAFLLHNGGYVICVDWGHMAEGKIGPEATRTLLYPFIVDNVARVGDYVGEFIVFLKENNAISSFDQIHVLGFSLGAHVSGIAGWTVQNKTEGEKVRRITGLDPAGPKFFLKSKERRLNKDDAKFVDVIHTSHLGYFLSMGHIDFFPNGGKIQPGCVETESGVTDAVASLGSVLSGSCSHARAWEYYTQSIKDNGLFGCECDNLFKYEKTGCESECEDKVPFGEPCPSTARGNYYLSI